jgi:glyoxylase-like metal-dependent hydrolase (beta-lactamase superfamily II)
MTNAREPGIEAFFHEPTNTASYLVWDETTREAAVIDPVLDFNHRTGRVKTSSADAILAAATKRNLKIVWVLETHGHADHLSAAPHIKAAAGAKVGIGEHIREVQRIFRPVFNAPDVSGEGAEFDRLFADGERFAIGGLSVEVLYTPGHTPACVSYRIGGVVFVGDTLFMPDYGTARADFPGGNARRLYQSIRRLMKLPDETRVFLCHDYKAPNRDEFVWETTIGAERTGNVHVHDGVTEDAFVEMRTKRDATLALPRLILPSIQVNMRGGRLPEPEDNGVSYLKLPLNQF